MDINEVLDQLNTYHTRVVKPFQHLGDVLQSAKQILDVDLPAAKRELEGFTKERTKAEEAAKAAQERAALAESEARTVERDCGERMRSARFKVKDAESAVQTAIDSGRQKIDTALGEAEQNAKASITALTTEIADLTAKRDAILAEIQRLKAAFA